jgi:single-strand DNA-binding protein
MSFEVEGKLIKKYDTENKTGTFQAREFVIEVMSGNYPQFVKFQLVQDRCILLDPFEEGDYMKVYFDLRGREWQGKYFTNLNAWRLDKAAAQQPGTPPPPADNSGFPTAADEPVSSSSPAAPAAPAAPEGDDDLPF